MNNIYEPTPAEIHNYARTHQISAADAERHLRSQSDRTQSNVQAAAGKQLAGIAADVEVAQQALAEAEARADALRDTVIGLEIAVVGLARLRKKREALAGLAWSCTNTDGLAAAALDAFERNPDLDSPAEASAFRVNLQLLAERPVLLPFVKARLAVVEKDIEKSQARIIATAKAEGIELGAVIENIRAKSAPPGPMQNPLDEKVFELVSAGHVFISHE